MVMLLSGSYFKECGFGLNPDDLTSGKRGKHLFAGFREVITVNVCGSKVDQLDI